MNWTEGTLNRHSRGRKGKEAILRQKEHFAKARSGLLNANVQTSPPSISFLAHPALTSSLVHHASLKSVRSSPKKRNDALESSRYFSEVHEESSNSATFQQQQARSQALRQKRHNLLFKGDWVGTGAQKPIEMKFSRPRDSPSRAWGARLTRHESSRHKLRQLLGVKHENGRNKTIQGGVRTSAPISLRKMRIRVGSRERTLCGSSNISRSHRGDGSSSHERHDLRHHDHREGCGIPDEISIPGSGVRTHQSSNRLDLPDKVPAPPLLFHPVPTRPALMQLLPSYSDDEDNADSIVAQVGVQRPFIPSAEVEENEMWRGFVADYHELQSSTDFFTSGNEKFPFDELVSPGVSQMDRTEVRGTGQKAPTHDPVLGSNGIDGDIKEATSVHPKMDLIQAGQLGIVGSENPLGSGQVVLAADDPSHQPPDTIMAHALEDSQTGGSETQGSSRSTSEVPGEEVSLLVEQSSPNPSLSPSSMACNDLLLQRFPKSQAEQANTEAVAQSPRPTGHQMPEDHSHAQFSTYDVQNSRQGTPEDENDIWRKFVFGGSDENLEQVRKDARKETAKNLRPSIASSSTCDEVSRPDTRSSEDIHENSTLSSTASRFGVDRHGFARDPQQLAINFSTTASASRVATAGASSPVPISEFQCSESTVQTDQATAGSEDSSSMAQTSLLGGLLKPGVVEPSSTETDQSPLIVQQYQPEKHGHSDEGFKFARPKLFIGKKLGPVDERRQIALSTAQIRGRTQRRGRPTRTRDGRANIRKLPNYGSDPIEEFEEDAQSDRAQQGSIFGSLETE